MLRIDVGPQDLAASRFAISPLHETTRALAALSGHRNDVAVRPWVLRRRERFRSLRRQHGAVQALIALGNTHGYQPDFIAPPPTGPDQTAEEQLAKVAATLPDRARHELQHSLSERTGPEPPVLTDLLGQTDLVAHLAEGLRTVWEELIEPDWPTIQAILRQDLLHRADLLVTHGWADALADLSPRVRWKSGGFIEIDGDQREELHPNDITGILFVPTIFGPLTLCLETPWPRAMLYPARGRALLGKGDAGQNPKDALERLIGRVRADLLRALEQPATTTQLTRTHRLSLGTVGHHLSVLRDSGLVTRTRTGQSVIYQRTPLGQALVTADSLRCEARDSRRHAWSAAPETGWRLS